MDNTTGYPYFWNRHTNEVKWDRPAEMPVVASNGKKAEPITEYPKKGRKKDKSPPQVFIGPTLPQLTPEEIARQKVNKFEEAMGKELEKEILKEDPPDWLGTSKPVKNLYSKPFAWKKTSTCIQAYKDLNASLKKASHSINLIAGSYADDDTEDEDNDKTSSSVQVKVEKPKSKVLLKNVFNDHKAKDEDPPKKKRRWGMILKIL